VVLFFGFTNCPDICPPTLARLAQTMKLLGTDALRVQVLFVTVDPRRDTPAQLAAFVPKFDPAFSWPDGDLAGTRRRGARLSHSAETDAGNPGHIPHSDAILVKDVKGKLRLLFKATASAEDIAHDLRLLLKQS